MSASDYFMSGAAIYVAPHVPKGAALFIGSCMTLIGLLAHWFGVGK